ncbi:MAG: prepilin-type N-terminal cleavage/methylation domain-containing protein [Planctomycetales bacterium]|nr:prepilin-type N-terminal cleavage/methylation domain-containing protein [Planctomycetales bacterium]
MNGRTQNGFTLIELSIVLVIIGLVVGGVVVGREVIEAAEMRAQVGEIDKIRTAVRTFGLQYNCLPGDCAYATRFFTATSQPGQVTNGNGNGRIYGYGYNENQGGDINVGWQGANSREWFRVFDHLAAANLTIVPQYDETTNLSNRAGVAYPRMKVNASPPANIQGPGGIAIGYEPGKDYIQAGNKIRLGVCFYVPWGQNTPVFSCGLASQSARVLDDKIDDGLPYSGIAVITAPAYIFRTPLSGIDETAGCAVYATNSYRPSTSTAQCAISIVAGF